MVFLKIAFVQACFSVAMLSYGMDPNVFNSAQLGLSTDHFHFKNCNTTVVPLYIRNLSINNPVQLGELLAGTISFDLTDGVGNTPVESALSIRLKTSESDTYTEVCELVGSYFCHLKDLCTYTERLDKFCPKVFQHGKNCSCPLNKGKYENLGFFVRTEKLPFELNGTFNVTVEMYETSRLLACIDIRFCISKCMFE